MTVRLKTRSIRFLMAKRDLRRSGVCDAFAGAVKDYEAAKVKLLRADDVLVRYNVEKDLAERIFAAGESNEIGVSRLKAFLGEELFDAFVDN